jgi:hypothetical protein
VRFALATAPKALSSLLLAPSLHDRHGHRCVYVALASNLEWSEYVSPRSVSARSVNRVLENRPYLLTVTILCFVIERP